jgi:regulator of nonsense transcripts 1
MFAAAPFGPGPIPRSGANGGKRAYGSYASSIISQDAAGSTTDGNSVVSAASSIAYSQSDRLRRRTSFSGSSVAGASDMGSLSSAYDYKSQDDAADLDDVKSQYTGTQSGLTVF